MKKLVIIPGGFHPFHAGHKALYDEAVAAFPSADVYIAATDDRSERPFPFAIKKKLAQLAGIPPHRFIQVKSPFKPDEITSHYPDNDTQLVFVKSLKNAKNGPDPEGPFPAERDENGNLPMVTRGARKGQPVSDWLQYYKRNGLAPMNQHGYLKYLPVHEFNGMTSGSEIRAKWTNYDDATKTQLINIMYPATLNNPRLTDVTVKLMDKGMGTDSKEAPAETKNLNKKAMNAIVRQHAPVDEDQGNGQLLAKTIALTPTGPAGASGEVDEATLVNDPEQGELIRPTGGLGTWTEDTLKSSLAQQFAEIIGMLKSGNYRGMEYNLYKAGAMQSKVQALARLEDFKQKQGRRPIARGREIDIGEDYIDESATTFG